MSLYQNTKSKPATPHRTNFLRRASLACTGIAIATAAALTLPLAASAAPAPEEVATAQSALDDTQRTLDTARQQHDEATTKRDTALRDATTLKTRAQEAADVADEATRAYIRLLRDGSAAAQASLTNTLEAADEKKLLDGFNGTERALDTTTGFVQRIAQYRNGATTLSETGTKAENAANAVPLADHKNTVSAAENEVALKRNHLTSLTIPKAENGNEIVDGWVKPTVGRVTDNFGPRPDKPVPGVNPFHSGTDFGAACGAPIVASTAGKVIEAGEQGTYGNWMLVQHDDGSQTGYAHIAPGGFVASVGDRVEPGKTIAKVGTTGASTGCHLHLEVRLNGSKVDPAKYFEERGVKL